MTNAKKTWSYLTGERRVNRVRVFSHQETGRLFLEYRDQGQKVRQALGHTDRARAKETADRLAAELRRFGRPLTGRLTLTELFDNYLREVTPTKSVGTQAHDRRAVELFLTVLGGDLPVANLNQRHIEGYVTWRRSHGDTRSGTKQGTSIGPRVIQYDVALLKAMTRWAVGARLLERNPLEGIRVPLGRHTPNSPVLKHEEYEAMLAVADAVHPTFRLALILAHETGHRINSIRLLRWSDVDLARGQVRWAQENDKTRFEHQTPLSGPALEALHVARASDPAIGNAWILPAPGDSAEPASRDRLRAWWQRAELLARLPPVPGRGWHSLRRAFATELKSIPLPDLCALGGWKDAQTILRCYQKPDATTMVAALAARERKTGS
jgi:integrase